MSGQFYFPEILAAGRRAVRLRQRRRSRRLLRAGPDARRRQRSAEPLFRRARPRAAQGPAVTETICRFAPDGTRDAAVHRRHGRRAASTRAATAWASRPATSTTTAASICTSPTSGRTSCSATTATARSPTSRGRAAPTIRAGACRRRSSTTTATAGSISSSATTSSTIVEANTPCSSLTGTPRLLHAAASTGRSRTGCITTTATARSPTSPPRRWHGARRSGRRSASSTADFNGDGWIDIYVANDGQENQLWINQRNGTFRNTGAAVGRRADRATARPKASMGVDAGDFDNDGDEDLFMTELTGEGQRSLRQRRRRACSRTRARGPGSAPPASAYTGFGTAWFDFDNDGWLDLADGQRRDRRRSRRRAGERSVSAATSGSCCSATSATAASRTSPRGPARSFQLSGSQPRRGVRRHRQRRRHGRRGQQHQRPARLLINNVGNRQPLARAAAGRRRSARPRHARRAGRGRRGRRLDALAPGPADGSYASANDPRVLVGLGAAGGAARVRITWPDGSTEERRTRPSTDGRRFGRAVNPGSATFALLRLPGFVVHHSALDSAHTRHFRTGAGGSPSGHLV